MKYHLLQMSHERAATKKDVSIFYKNVILRGAQMGIEGTDLLVPLIEGIHCLEGRPTIFIEDEQIVEAIYKSHFDVDFESIKMPLGDTVSFVFSQKIKINNYSLPSCLVSKINVPFAFKRLGLPNWVVEDPNMDRLVIFHFNKRDYTHNFSICKNTDQLKDYTNNEQNWWRLTNEDIPNYEKEILLILGRVCFGLLILLTARPEMLRDGLPNQCDARETRILGKSPIKRSHITMHKSYSHSSPIAYIRKGARWHFRCLRDPRYKRNPDGSTRVIFVSESKPTIVGARAEAHTLKEN